MSFCEEFSDFPVDAMPALPEGFIDSSWHNDACPLLINEARGLAVWVDFPDPAMREMQDGSRFLVCSWSEEDGTGADDERTFGSDDWTEVLQYLDSLT